ncbi:MAG: hypothetical protein HY579_05290 [Nitrospinae bacterium]|nr:hypothetical protein [Nitrospinota bacterium]
MISHLCLPRVGPLEKIGLGFGLGMGVVTLLVFFLLLSHSLSSVSLVLSEIAILVLLGLACARKKRGLPPGERPGFFFAADEEENRASILFCLAIITFLALSGFAFSSVIPVMEADALNYSVFGRSVAIANDLAGITEGLYKDHRQRTPLVPLTYALVESVNGPLPKIAHPLFYLSFLLVFFGRATGLGLRTEKAVLLTTLLASAPLVWWHGVLSLNNLATGYYFCSATFFMTAALFEKEAPRKSYALLSGVFYAFAVWARLEFLAYFIIPLLVLIRHSLRTDDFRLPFYLSFPPLALGGLWAIYVHLFINGQKFPRKDLLVIAAIIAILSAYAAFYERLVARGDPDRRGGWSGYLNVAENFCGRNLIAAVSAALIPIVVLGEFKVFENVSPALNYFLVSARARIFQTLMHHGYWIFTNTLLFAFLFGLFPLTREMKYLFFILALLVAFHNALYLAVGHSKGHEISGIGIIKAHIFNAGHYVNGSSTRELIAFYPIVIFAAALGWNAFSRGNPGHQARSRGTAVIVKSAIALNLTVLLCFFWIPRAVFVAKHFGESQRELLLSEGPKDIPNYFQTANQWAFRVKDRTPDNAVIVAPLEHSIGPFSMASILLPRKTAWFQENTQPDPSIYTRHGDRPVYAITAGGWFPLAPYETLETFRHQEFEVSLVRILNTPATTP